MNTKWAVILNLYLLLLCGLAAVGVVLLFLLAMGVLGLQGGL